MIFIYFSGTTCTQLRKFDHQAFLKLLQVALKNDTRLGSKELFWNYLREHFSSSLTDFEKLKILPVETKQGLDIWPLLSKQPWLCVSELNLSEEIKNILEQLGVKLIASLPDFVTLHICMSHYIKSGEQGIVQCLELLQDVNIDSFEQIPTCDRNQFRLFLAKLFVDQNVKIDYLLQRILKGLCIFPAFDHDTLISLQDCSMGSSEKPPYSIGELLSDLRDENVKTFCLRLGVKEKNMSCIIQEFILSNFWALDEKKQDEWSLYVLENFTTLKYQNTGIVKMMEDLAFVKSQAGSRSKAVYIYDPKEKVLQLLANASQIPCKIYQNHLDILRELHMKNTESLTGNDVVGLMNNVMLCEDQTEPNKHTLILAFIELINKRNDLLSEDNPILKEQLSEYPWIPVKKHHSQYPQNLHWKGSEIEYAKPNEVLCCSDETVNLVGSQCYLVDSSITGISGNISKYFDWNRKPSVDDMLSHLKHMTDRYAEENNPLYEISFGHLCSAFEINFEKMNSSQIEDLRCRIWHGMGFTSLEHVVKHPPMKNMEPYIYQLPQYLHSRENLLTRCGMKSACDLVTVLDWIKSGKKSTNIERNRKLAVAILSELVKLEDFTKTLREKIVIPVQDSVGDSQQLKPIKQCAYHPVQWKPKFDLESVDLPEDVWLVHSDVPESLVKSMRVPPIHVQELDAENMVFEQFGQHEPLTTRIHNILKNYKDGFAVPKELIQNADDAGASEVKFLYDSRKNQESVTTLFDPGMEECQGPALWAYNNAKFTDEDFNNIIRLGSGSKEMKNDKVGRFGLGFNAVYNLTDVPSFVSGNHLVVFDPHTKYLGECLENKNNPGIRLKITKKKISNFKDQFQPYEGIFGFQPIKDTEKEYNYNGTLFRLPLRTRIQAANSEISDVYYSEEEMESLIEKVIEGAHTMLLFTQHVKTVSFYVMHQKGQSPSMLFELKKEAIKTPLHPNLERNILEKTAALLKEEKREKIQSMEVVKTVLDFVGTLKTGFRRGSFNIPKEKHWLLSNTSGIGRVYDEAIKKKNLVPVGGVAIEILKTGGKFTTTQTSGQMFCFLPLPVENGMPVHINGFFAVNSDRRQLEHATADDKNSEGAKWNNLVLSEVVAEAYIKALCEVTSLCSESISYHYLWPTYNEQNHDLKCLLDKFFSDLATDDKIALFSDGKRWAPLKDILYLSDEDFPDKTKKDVASNILRKCEPAKTVIDFPEKVKAMFVNAGMAEYVNNCYCSKKKLFANYFFPKIESLSNEERDTLLKMALADSCFYELIQNVACIPCTPDGILKKPQDLIHQCGKAAELYTPGELRFPFNSQVDLHNYCQSDVLKQLVNLGMVTDLLDWPDIIDRAKTVPTVETDVGMQRFEVLMEMIRSQLKNCKALPQELNYINFLPVQHTTKNSCLPWKSDENNISFTSYAIGYSSKWKDVICHVEPVIDDTSVHYQLKKYLIPKKEPSCGQILSQHSLLLKHFHSSAFKEGHVPQMTRNCEAIYHHLNTLLRKSEINISDTVVHFKENGIWIESDFQKPETCALNFCEKCSPWLNAIPTGLQIACKEIFFEIGVKDTFNAEDYHKALVRMKSKNEKLIKEDLDKAIKIVNGLANSIGCVDIKKVQDLEKDCGDPIFIPDEDCFLRPRGTVCFGDSESMGYLQKDKDTYFAHKNLSFQVGKTLLGVKTLKQQVVSKRSKRFGRPFGQSEPLTTRIKNLLDSYPCDEGILKELVQNADDAKAKEIHFILDQRNLPRHHLLCDGWEDIQGPSLLVYNDSTFTKEDLDGIKNLGLGSKSDDPTKTGQYGVGFNCVYHVTDTPTFLTTVEGEGEVLVAFDPNLCLDDATEEEPGALFMAEELKEMFPNVFQAYNLQGHVSSKGKGTLFRLPLRTEKQAWSSKLGKSFSVDKVKHLLDSFKREMRNVFLFLNHLEKIEILCIDREGRTTEQYFVQCTISDAERLSRKLFQSKVLSDCKDLGSQKLSLEGITREEIFTLLNIEDSAGMKEKWAITQSFGFSDIDKIRGSEVANAYTSGQLRLLPRGGVAALLNQNDQSNKTKVRTWSQLGKLDLDSQKESDLEICKKRLLYCFLPLPIETELPVHLNGHFCLGHESRRTLWKEASTSYRSQWNDFLMEFVIAPSYISLMKYIQVKLDLCTRPGLKLETCVKRNNYVGSEAQILADVKKTVNKYNAFFPSVTGTTDKCIEKMVKSFYVLTEKNHEMVMPAFMKETVDGPLYLNWFPPTKQSKREAVYKYFQWKTHLKNNELRDVLVDAGYIFFHTTCCIKDMFLKYDVPLCESTPRHVLDFFIHHKDEGSSCLIPNLPKNCRNTCLITAQRASVIIEYCSEAADFVQDNLDGAPLLITQDEMVQEFTAESEIYFTRFNTLVPQRHNQFVHTDLLWCIDWMKCSGHPVAKQFTMKELSNIIQEKLPPEFKTCETYLLWNLHDSQINIAWLVRFWEFLEECCKSCQKDQNSSVEKVYHNTVEPMEDWCLVPGLVNGQMFLVPLGKPHLLVDLNVSTSYYDNLPALHRALLKLQCPHVLYLDDLIQLGQRQINTGSIPAECMQPYKQYLYSVVSVVDKPELFFIALQHWTLNNMSQVFGALEFAEDEIQNLLNYFSFCFQHIGNDLMITTMKKLPIFLNISNLYVPITGQPVAVPPKIPLHGLAALSDGTFVFFKTPLETSHQKLFRVLGFKFPEPPTFYVNYIFPNFQKLDRLTAWTHIDRIISIWKSNAETQEYEFQNFLAELRCLKFVPCHGGHWASANEFYYPNEPVFKCMLSEANFPPDPPSARNTTRLDWLDFLGSIGMVLNVTEEMLLQFASQLENDARCYKLDGYEQKVKILLENLYYKQQNFRSLAEKVSKMKLVPLKIVNSKLLALRHQHGNDRKEQFGFVALDHGIVLLEEKEVLVWTAANLLPRWTCPVQHRCTGTSLESAENRISALKTALKVHFDEVPVNIVVQNARNISEEVKRRRETGQEKSVDNWKLLEVLIASYEHLQENRDDQLEPLKELPFVAVEQARQLVKPCQIAMEIACDEIPPYLYKIPIDLGKYHELFSFLGATKSASTSQFVQIMTELKLKYSEDKVTDPNDQIAASRALFGLMVLFKQPQIYVGDSVRQIPPFFVLSAADKMSPIKDLCFLDDPAFKGRVNELTPHLLTPFGNMQKIAEITSNSAWKGIEMDGDRVFTYFPENVRPKKLSDNIEEVCSKYELLGKTIKEVYELKDRFQSGLFLKALKRVLRSKNTCSAVEIDEISRKLQHLEIISVKELQTQLKFAGSVVSGSDKAVPCFIDDKSNPAKLFVKENMEWQLKTILPQRLNKHILKSNADLHALSEILQNELHLLSEILDELQIEEDHSKDDFITLPACGDFIPLEDHHLLCQAVDVLREGEYVGYLLEEIETDNGEILMTFIYAKVLEEIARKDTESVSKRYRVDVGGENPLEVSIIELYRFHRKSEVISGPLVLVEKDETDSTGVIDEKLDRPLDEIMKEITKILEEAWKLPEDERKKLVRRLLRKWHPDKNPDNVDNCTEICKFIQTEISRLDKKAEADDATDGNFTSNYYQSYYRKAGSWGRKQSYYRNNYKEHYQNYQKQYHTSGSSFQYDRPPPSFSQRNPQPGEARRWMRQAWYDVSAAQTERQGNYEWSCFKSHQVTTLKF